MRKKNINYKIARYVKTSLVVSIALKLMFLPYSATKYYFNLMMKKTSSWLVLNLVFVCCVLFYAFICYLTLPDIKKLYYYKPVLSSKFYDRNSELIFELGSEKRSRVDINEVPQQLINAFISAEDKTFYTNYGIDVYGLVKAGIKDVYKFFRGQKLAGASTITQQVVKNVLLTSDRTITRKIKEIFLSYRISKLMPKDKIMEIYLNHIYLGMQAYGVVSASDEYFGKPLGQLTVPEMALLASLPKAPSSLNPFNNYNRAMIRRNWVLLRMMEDGYITKSDYENYVNTEIIVKRKRNINYPFYAPAFFAQSVMSSKEINLKKNDIMNNGYRIDLTIDKNLQVVSQKALNASLENYARNHGFSGPLYTFSEKDMAEKTPAQLLKSVNEPDVLGNFRLAVVLEVKKDETIIGLNDNSTGKIRLNDMTWARKKISEIEVDKKAIENCNDVLQKGDVVVVAKQGNGEGIYYSLEQIPEINGAVIVMNPKTGEILSMVGGYMDQAGGFNRTVQAFRQLGSTIKPFVYAAALEKGFTPASIFMDAELSINLGDGQSWNPKNHNGLTNGPVTLRTGLEKSKNTVTVRIAESVGLKRIRNMIINAGINKKPDSNFSIVLGAVESSLVNIIKAFSAFVNNGDEALPYLISSIAPINNIDNIEEKGGGKTFGHIYFDNCDINLKCELRIGKKVSNNKNSNSDVINNINSREVMYNGGAMGETYDINSETAEGQFENYNHNREQSTITEESFNNSIRFKKTPISPETAYQIAYILNGAVLRGTASRLAPLGINISAKTGTSNDGKDMWTIAFSPDIIIGVYVGYDKPIITNNYGSQYAAPVVKDILSYLIEKQMKFAKFQAPETIKFVKIDKNTGKQVVGNETKNTIFEAFRVDDIIEIKEETEDNNDTEDIDITDVEM